MKYATKYNCNSEETDRDELEMFSSIFEKYKLITRVKLAKRVNTPVLFLIFVIITFIHVCVLYHLKLNNGTFQM